MPEELDLSALTPAERERVEQELADMEDTERDFTRAFDEEAAIKNLRDKGYTVIPAGGQQTS